ncbi:MAG: methyltransferase domain-containing protein [candidate division Zixibacteria bacterium]|nr:methyltransferase domain-containing protein [candidate division Zixibacteria bacterium]
MKPDKSKTTDFSRGRHKDMLVWQRKRLWTEEAIERYAKWLNLSPGMIAVDIGCGLGFLGYSYWKYFGKGGHYIGIDIKQGLLKDAREASKKWATGGKADFTTGDVYNLPIPDCCADWAMCQTLMIHLENPKLALSEMIRILKPGGLLLCIEPDNLRPALDWVFSSLPKLDLETQLLFYKVNTIANDGRIKMGRGDRGVAPSIPHMLSELGIDDLEILTRDTVPFLEPPYKTERQQEMIANMKKHVLNDENFNAMYDEFKEEFINGGGNIREFDKLYEISKNLREIQLQQMENKEFFICGAHPIYLFKGRKAK